jgi:hypothetical protein
MRLLACAAVLFWTLVGPGQPAKANAIGVDLYGVSWDEVSGLLYQISEAGPGAEIGGTGVAELNSLALAPSQELQSAGLLIGDPGRSWLVSIDPAGAPGALATPLAVLDLGLGDDAPDIRGLTYDLAGTLFLIQDPTGFGGTDDLYRLTSLDLTGQVATAELVGPTGFTAVQALTTSPLGALYAWDVNAGLLTVDPATGVATDVNPSQGGTGDIQAISFGPDGRLFGARNSLFEIDPATGAFTELGLIVSGDGANVRGLAAVPEPGTGALLALAAAGLLFLRRRPR